MNMLRELRQKVYDLAVAVEKPADDNPFLEFLSTSWDDLTEEAKREILQIIQKDSSHD